MPSLKIVYMQLLKFKRSRTDFLTPSINQIYSNLGY
jgi:hypothetical protein